MHYITVLKTEFIANFWVAENLFDLKVYWSWYGVSEPARRVTSYYESSSVTKILPLMTQPFDYKQKQSILPKWEELLLFNENFEQVFQTDKNKNVVIFFEIIDFLPMALANKKLNRYGQKGKQLK